MAPRNLHHAAGDHIAFFVFRDVFIQAAGNKLLYTQAQLAFLRIDRQHLGLHQLTNLQHFLRMIDALLRAHIADVNHALDAFGELHEGAELGDADDWPFNDRARGKLLRRIGPRISKCLFQSQRHSALGSINPENNGVHDFTGLYQRAGAPQFLSP